MSYLINAVFYEIMAHVTNFRITSCLKNCLGRIESKPKHFIIFGGVTFLFDLCHKLTHFLVGKCEHYCIPFCAFCPCVWDIIRMFGIYPNQNIPICILLNRESIKPQIKWEACIFFIVIICSGHFNLNRVCFIAIMVITVQQQVYAFFLRRSRNKDRCSFYFLR